MMVDDLEQAQGFNSTVRAISATWSPSTAVEIQLWVAGRKHCATYLLPSENAASVSTADDVPTAGSEKWPVSPFL